MLITNAEFEAVVRRENPDGCMGLRHYIVNNGTPYAQIEAVYDSEAAKYCGCPGHAAIEKAEKETELYNLPLK